MQKDQTLSATNNWTVSYEDLNKTDSVGEDYEYEVKEEKTSVINGNSKTGYEIAYDVKESTDKSTGITTITNDITNTHTPDPTTKSIMKNGMIITMLMVFVQNPLHSIYWEMEKWWILLH